MVNLIATKSLTYKTRRLQADDLFEARPRDARILQAIGKAKEAPAKAEKAPRYVPVDERRATMDDTHRPADDDRAALREEYTEVVGKKPFGGWDAETLREKIAAAKSGD